MVIEKRLLPGQIIIMADKIAQDTGRPIKIKKSYEVVKQYKHHVLVVNGHGIRQCFTNVELWQQGIVKPALNIINLAEGKPRKRVRNGICS